MVGNLNAKAIRAFIHELFQTQYSRLLEKQLEEVKLERDYFKGRAERLDMLLLSRPQPIRYALPTDDKIHVGGRKTLAQLQKDLTEQEQREQSKKEN